MFGAVGLLSTLIISKSPSVKLLLSQLRVAELVRELGQPGADAIL